MVSTSNRIGHALAKGLSINLDYRKDATEERARRQSITSRSKIDNYVEKEPTAAEWLEESAPNGQSVKSYFKELFPFLAWITRYNLQWLTGDLIAGGSVNSMPLFSLTYKRSYGRGRCGPAGHGLCFTC